MRNITKAKKFREMLVSPELEFICEAHNGISAKIVEEAGFKGIWGSGLTISATMGVRDSNEASWTQVLDVLEFMADATSIPLLIDADTGYGNFNNVRRLVKKLEQRGIAAVCIEDKLFPKTNSLLENGRQQLADIDEFAGKIKAAKDAQTDPHFSVVARLESFIAGHGLADALRRADAYHRAGADAILVHSKISRPDEVLAFKKEWADRSPVIIVPTKYYRTPAEVFREAGFSMVIWANMILRSALLPMKETAAHLAKEQSLLTLNDRIASVGEIFRLQGAEELEEAEKRYLPFNQEKGQAIILAASQGKEFGALTEEKPKALLEISGRPILYKQIDTLREIGVSDITVVRGFRKELIDAPDIHYIDNDDYADTQEAASLLKGIENMNGKTLITYGDILYKKYIPTTLFETEGDFVIAVDADWHSRYGKSGYADFVSCDKPYQKKIFDQKVKLIDMSTFLKKEDISGEWTGLLSVSPRGLDIIKATLHALSKRENFKKARIAELFRELIKQGREIKVFYISGHWLDIDDIHDLSYAGSF